MIWDPSSTEHFRTYDTLARRLGLLDLIRLVPYTREQLQAQADRGNAIFNGMGTLPERKVQQAGLGRFGGGSYTPWDQPYAAVWELAKEAGRREGLVRFSLPSLASCVCVLKHVARYYVLGMHGPDGPCETPEEERRRCAS